MYGCGRRTRNHVAARGVIGNLGSWYGLTKNFRDCACLSLRKRRCRLSKHLRNGHSIQGACIWRRHIKDDRLLWHFWFDWCGLNRTRKIAGQEDSRFQQLKSVGGFLFPRRRLTAITKPPTHLGNIFLMLDQNRPPDVGLVNLFPVLCLTKVLFNVMSL